MRRPGTLVLCLLFLWSLKWPIPFADGSALKSLEKEIEVIVKETQPSLVSIYTKGGFGPQKDVGSGVIIRPTGYILTTRNVVNEGDQIEVILWDEKCYQATLVGSDPESNIAVLKIEKDGLTSAKMGDWARMKPGSWVIVLGNSFGLVPSVSFGLFSGRTKDGLLQMSASVSPGNSGGGVLNSDGELVGIVTGTASGPVRTSFFGKVRPPEKGEKAIDVLSSKFELPYQGISLAIPINEAKAVASQLIEKGRVERGWLGVIIQDLTPSLSEHFGVKQGVLVSDVVDESPAQKAGMKRGDVIIEYGEEMVTNSDQLRDMVTSTSPGKQVKLLIIRDSKEMWMEVKIGKKPKYSRIGKEETWRDFQFPDLDWLKEEFSSEGIKEKLEKLEEQIEKLKQRLDSD
jgi:serine protease Do